jgi:hypothetical protein
MRFDFSKKAGRLPRLLKSGDLRSAHNFAALRARRQRQPATDCSPFNETFTMTGDGTEWAFKTLANLSLRQRSAVSLAFA